MRNLFFRHKQPFSGRWAGVMVVFSLALLCPPAVRGMETMALTKLEEAIAEAPPVLVAAAALEESLARLEREQAVSGLQILGSGGTGSYNEPKDESQVRDYNQAFGRLSLRYPLLGTRDQERGATPADGGSASFGSQSPAGSLCAILGQHSSNGA